MKKIAISLLVLCMITALLLCGCKVKINAGDLQQTQEDSQQADPTNTGSTEEGVELELELDTLIPDETGGDAQTPTFGNEPEQGGEEQEELPSDTPVSSGDLEPEGEQGSETDQKESEPHEPNQDTPAQSEPTEGQVDSEEDEKNTQPTDSDGRIVLPMIPG